MAEMHTANGGDHHRDDQDRSQRLRQSEHKEQSAEEFSEGGDRGECAAGSEANPFEELASARDALAAEPAEQFQGAVAGHQHAKDKSNQKQSGTHDVSLSNVAIIAYRCLHRTPPKKPLSQPGFWPYESRLHRVGRSLANRGASRRHHRQTRTLRVGPLSATGVGSL
jgi:hypothetical protein